MSFKNRKSDTFKGHKGKIRRKQLFQGKRKNKDLVNDEILSLKGRYGEIDPGKIKQFTNFPLSKKTLQGLESCKYESPTDIQRESIGLALQGHDILGAAKTGSGKTLAFIVPVLECLYGHKWSPLDGLGALIISPTRELAYQTFEVLKKLGKFHDFSAGLVIGGKPLKEEAGRINRTNIVICTPGRLLQHMDETTYFTADTLKVLVLDEADRILDMGFAQTMNAVIENLPSARQTLLFSATQTRSVKDLARLSLKEPMFVSVHANAIASTPVGLEQSYVVCELHDKINMLWSFLRNHLKCKILVFVSSCKQVKYVYEAVRRLRPGIPVLALHGGMPQLRRVAAYNQFIWKQHVCMFATDIAARGLDFPGVNWVIQLDCPEDASTYIHRAGRTARYEKDGEALLVLLPSEEEAMVGQLRDKKIPIEKIRVNQSKWFNIQPKMEANCAADPALKDTAQRAFVAYLRSIFLMSNKKVFNVHAVDTEKFARSLGLAMAPKVRFLKREQKRLAEKAVPNAASVHKKGSRMARPGDDGADSGSGESSGDDSASSDSQSEAPGSRLKPESPDSETDSDTGKKNLKSHRQLPTKPNSLDKHLKEPSDGKLRKGHSNVETDESDSETESSGPDADNRLVNKMKAKFKASQAKSAIKPDVRHSSDSSSSESDGNSVDEESRHTIGELGNNKHKKPATSKNKVPQKLKTQTVKHKDSSSSGDGSSESESSESSDVDHQTGAHDGADSDSSDSGSDSPSKEDKPHQSEFRFDVDQDDDELFTVKKDVDIEQIMGITQDVEEPDMRTRKEKPLTKYAAAKRIQKKQLQVNTKVTFDDEGEEIADQLRSSQVAMDTEREDEAGGINIARARQRMQQEDKLDKELYRQKIKQRHREERLKKREENRAKKRRAEDEEPGDGEGEAVLVMRDGDGADPLDFLPDPDDVYGPRQSGDSDLEDFDSPRQVKKRKTQPTREASDSESHNSSADSDVDDDSDGVMDTGLSLPDDEELAIKLLQGR